MRPTESGPSTKPKPKPKPPAPKKKSPVTVVQIPKKRYI